MTSLASGADLRPLPANENYYEALTKPADTHNAVTKGVAAKLAKSRISTREEAEKIALQAFVSKPGLDARETWAVSGLYHLGRDVPDFGSSGDLVWEVRVSRITGGISGVIWVSSSTGAARVLFP